MLRKFFRPVVTQVPSKSERVWQGLNPNQRIFVAALADNPRAAYAFMSGLRGPDDCSETLKALGSAPLRLWFFGRRAYMSRGFMPFDPNEVVKITTRGDSIAAKIAYNERADKRLGTSWHYDGHITRAFDALAVMLDPEGPERKLFQ